MLLLHPINVWLLCCLQSEGKIIQWFWVGFFSNFFFIQQFNIFVGHSHPLVFTRVMFTPELHHQCSYLLKAESYLSVYFLVALFLFSCLAHAICAEGGWQAQSIQLEKKTVTLYKLLSMSMIEGPFLVVTTRCVYSNLCPVNHLFNFILNCWQIWTWVQSSPIEISSSSYHHSSFIVGNSYSDLPRGKISMCHV